MTPAFKSSFTKIVPAVKHLFAFLVSYFIYTNQDLISDDSIHAFLMAISAIVAVFTLSGSWDLLTNGKEIRFFSKLVIPNYYFIYIALSFLFAYQVFQHYSPYMFDDSAFTLRYLDNFWDGYFYHYNKTDPPVFGVSCFTFGVFTGFWCWLHILTPEQSIHLAGFSGLIAISFLVLKILRELVNDNRLILIFWLAVIFSSKMFLNVAKSGMESSFHDSFVLAALLFFLQNKSKWMWLLLAVSVISKLDTVPLVMVVGITYLLINRKKFLPLSIKNQAILELIYFAAIPLVLWVIFAFAVFGSPLPQSAYSKIFLHYHPSDYWFPFFKYYVLDSRVHYLFILFFSLFLLHFVFVLLKNKKFSFKNLVFGFSFFAILLLFYFYNPGEQMTWYYVLPDLLMLLQLTLSFSFFLNFIPQKSIRILLVSVGIFFFTGWIGMDVIGGKYWMETYLETVERERLEVGKYVGNIVGEKDSIMSNHGLPVRHVKGYVIDMSGLNSRFAADYKIDPKLLFQQHHPQWTISHNSAPYAALISSNGYEPVRLFYDITAYAFPQWCLYKKLSSPSESRIFKPIDSTHVFSTKPSYKGGIVMYHDDSIKVQIDSVKDARQICFGVQRGNLPFHLIINKWNWPKPPLADTLIIEPIGEFPLDSKYTKAIQLKLNENEDFNTLELTTDAPGFSFTIVEPYIYKKK